MELEKILEEIKFMSYDDLNQVLDAVSRRMARLDKYEDMHKEALEEMYRDVEDYEYPQI